jgi:hypothetical protein
MIRAKPGAGQRLKADASRAGRKYETRLYGNLGGNKRNRAGRCLTFGRGLSTKP